jgi:glycosyltransferase involved in cell wall biosynthesis
VSVIVPVYNEADTVAEVVARVLALDPAWEVVLVDDGSTDGTPAALADLPSDPRLLVHRLPANLGKGAAVRTGLALARGEFVVVQDADLELEPEELTRVLAPLLAGEAEAVYGSRFRQGRGGAPLGLYWANRALTLVANLLYRCRLTDEATGYKACSRELWLSLNLQAVGFELCPEVTAKLLRRGARIREVPVAYRPRGKQQGKKLRALRDGLRALWTLLKWRVLPVPRGPGGPESVGTTDLRAESAETADLREKWAPAEAKR